MALVLQTHPKLVHLDEVGKHERDRVLQVALGTAFLALAARVATVMSERTRRRLQPADGPASGR